MLLISLNLPSGTAAFLLDLAFFSDPLLDLELLLGLEAEEEEEEDLDVGLELLLASLLPLLSFLRELLLGDLEDLGEDFSASGRTIMSREDVFPGLESKSALAEVTCDFCALEIFDLASLGSLF
jgi:hypothetical protein